MTMSLQPGTTLGPYQVIAKIGEGGMGEVYQARDTKLDRDVALKVLPEAFTSDPERLARFEREAKVLASLNHPNIGSIYGLEEADGVRALVLELVDGPTLADRIKQGAIPIDEALPIAKQIAEALEAAHEQGVIHRDLKPANIKLRPDGAVNVLDFGLAKALEGDAGSDPSEAPTRTAAANRAGVIMGTAAYMSPEQARGRPLDKRTDIWSFGCVLYEILAARRAFAGTTLPDTLAAIIEREPVWDALPPQTPSRVRDLLRRCLHKRATQRLRDIGDARIELDEAGNPALVEVSLPVPGADQARHRWRAIAGAAVAALVVVVVVVLSRGVGPDTAPASTFSTSDAIATQLTNYGPRETASALSPDGRSFAFVSDHAGTPDVWLRQVSGGDLVRLTDDAELESHLIFAPDGEAIYFRRALAIWRIGTLGGQARTIMSAASHPSPSPDGQRLAYYVGDGAGEFALTVGTLDGSPTKTLAEGVLPDGLSVPAWSPDGQFLTFTRAGLFAPFNLFVVDVDTGETRQVTNFTTSFDGIRAHVWLPDNRHLVVSYVVGGVSQFASDLGILDIEDGSISRLTLSVAQAFGGLSVSADGSRLIATAVEREREVWKVPFGPDPEANGRAATRVLDRVVDPMWTYVSRDGTTLLYNTATTGSRNLWTMPLDGSAPARQITTISGGSVMHSSLSPDGTRVAFVSSARATGSSDVWVQNVDGSGLRQLTDDEDADSWPAWSPDGRTIVFTTMSPDRGRRTRRVPVDGGPAEEFLDGFFRGDVIRQPDGTGTGLVTRLVGGVGGLRLIEYENGTMLWAEQLGGTGLSLPMFSPDGQLISMPSAEGRDRDSIWVFDSATGDRRRAVSFSGRFRMYFRADWTDDGTAFIVNRYETTSHVMLFDEFWSDSESSR